MASKKNRRLGIILGIVVVAMFGFGYLLVPLYDVLCDALNINGKTGGPVAKSVAPVDQSRTITVQFLATTNGNLPWEFYPLQKSIKIHPGENRKIEYFAKNLSGATMSVQAVPSVTPGLASKYLKKTECFCFNQQTLASKATMEMPMIFHIDRDLPKTIRTVTLSYTLFNVTDKKKRLSNNKTPGRI